MVSNTQLISTLESDGRLIVELREETLPEPTGHQILVRIEAAPINPSDLGLLFGGFLEQALSHHEFDIAAGNEDLLKSILHPADAVGDKGKTRAVENGFLDTGHETEAQILADLANLSEEV